MTLSKRSTAPIGVLRTKKLLAKYLSKIVKNGLVTTIETNAKDMIKYIRSETRALNDIYFLC